jgi:zinc D-Ala-D-Ala carboxypeptidase
MKLSKNLSVREFTKSNTAERRGIDNSIPKKYWLSAKALAENIFQPIREHFDTPIYISSGFRSEALNEAIGGSKTSQHSKGEAIDIDMDHRNGPTNAEVFYYIKDNLPFDQLIWEFGDEDNPSWVHVSYNPDGEQRGKILVAYKSNGKTKYKFWDR